ncbi:LOW QUALITY PROTEIN: hypothetical protein HID58_062166, partial [Brassica napus]
SENTMKLFTISMMTIMVISIVFVQVPSTTQARPLEITDNQNHFKSHIQRIVMDIRKWMYMHHRHSDYFKVARKLKKNDESTKDFAPTDPGNSPGIGHPKMDVHAPRLGVI